MTNRLFSMYCPQQFQHNDQSLPRRYRYFMRTTLSTPSVARGEATRFAFSVTSLLWRRHDSPHSFNIIVCDPSHHRFEIPHGWNHYHCARNWPRYTNTGSSIAFNFALTVKSSMFCFVSFPPEKKPLPRPKPRPRAR